MSDPVPSDLTSIPSEIAFAILAGGKGTRLQSVIADRPKVLAPVCGKPFLAWCLDAIARLGPRRVVLCTGYMAELVQEVMGKTHGSLELVYSVETTPLGTGGCLRQAWKKSEASSLFVLNGDSFCSPDFVEFFQAWKNSGCSAGIVLREMEDTSRYGRVERAPDGRVLSFQEKKEGAGAGWINAGVYLLTDKLLQPLSADGAPSSIERDHFPSWVPGGIYGHPYNGPFLDIGTPESYAQAEAFFSQTHPNP